MAQVPTYLEASFAGIPFQYDTTSRTFGRRGAEHQYINDDVPYFEDMGRQFHKFTLEAIFIGEDHLDQSRRFQRRVEQVGSGTLITPEGVIEAVSCVSGTARFDRTQQGLTAVSLEFIEQGEFRHSSDALATLAGVLDEVEGYIDDVINTVQAPVTSVVALRGRLLQIAQTASRAGVVINGDSSTLLALVETITDPEDLVTVATDTTPAVQVLGPISEALSASQAEFDAQRGTVALYTLLNVLQTHVFETKSEILTLANGVQTSASTVTSLTSDQELLSNMRRVACAINRELQDRLAATPATRVVDLGSNVNAVVAAHRIFCDYTRIEDITSRNDVLHPLFLPRYVEVVSQ